MENTTAAEVTGKIMVVAFIILFLVVTFVLFLRLYAKWFWWQEAAAADDGMLSNYSESTRSQRPPPPRRRHFVFTTGPGLVRKKRGLDAALLRSLKVPVWKSDDDGLMLECAVCLCELVEGDTARVLPKCNHGFHLECIDMWFQSHSTCPLCRDIIVQMGAALEDEEGVPPPNNVPTVEVVVNAAESRTAI